MVTREEVAKYAGVSTATVSRVLSKSCYVSREIREKVENAVKQLNYIPNKLAKNLIQNKSNVVAVLVEDVTNPYYLQILDAMTSEGMQYGLIISMFAVNKADIDAIIENLIENRVCAIINLALFSCGQRYIDILDKVDIYTVDVKPSDRGFRPYFNLARGMEEMFRVLHEKGRNKLIYIAALHEDIATLDIRLTAYRNFCEKYGFTQNPDYVIYGDYPDRHAFEVGYDSIAKILEAGLEFDSVFCLNDSVAFGAMKCLLEHGVKIPDDACIIGCDNIDFSQYVHPSLSTIDMQTWRQGKIYIRAVVEKLTEGFEQIDAKLICRESIG